MVGNGDAPVAATAMTLAEPAEPAVTASTNAMTPAEPAATTLTNAVANAEIRPEMQGLNCSGSALSLFTSDMSVRTVRLEI